MDPESIARRSIPSVQIRFAVSFCSDLARKNHRWEKRSGSRQAAAWQPPDGLESS
jgi:hypothetical protein